MPKLKIIILLIIIFVIVSLFGLALFGYYIKKEQKSFSLMGVITEKGDNFVKIKQTEQNNQIFTINIDLNTRFAEITIPKAILQENNLGDIFQEQKIQFSDLELGDEIVVVGSESLAETILKTQLHE